MVSNIITYLDNHISEVPTTEQTTTSTIAPTCQPHYYGPDCSSKQSHLFSSHFDIGMLQI